MMFPSEADVEVGELREKCGRAHPETSFGRPHGLLTC